MNGAPDPYDDREQTWVKHDILRRYLLRLAVIVGTWADSITYVDCFSGPWENKTDDFSDTSFAIAIAQLRAAREELAKKGRTLKLRCLFIEENAASFAKLDRFSKSIADVEIRCIQGQMADNIDAISTFVAAGGRLNFPFVFIDPTGWSGFLGILSILFTVLEFYAARCLKQRRNMLLIQIVAGIYCIGLPWGTMLGVCTFMVLARPSVKALFT